jgi:hypothetical protein
MLCTPRYPRARDVQSPQHCHPPQARKATLYIFLCHFGPTNPDFHMLYCHIALICYIAFVLLHYIDMLHCHIALICYIITILWYATLLLFCCIALMWYIVTLLWYATLPLTCRIDLICYIAFDMLDCFDMLYCFDMIHCHIAQWWKWAKWDECGNMDQYYCTIKISASNNMQ